MREILFRGKPFDNNEWVYGHLAVSPCGEYFIIKKFWRNTKVYVHVDSKTVGQYTEIQDIWGGDIVIDKLTNIKYLVEWKIGSFWLCPLDSGHEVLLLSDRMLSISKIGNKWDNPELLEEE